MAKIPLRTYNREIEGMIDRGQAAQAISHGRHILKFFPKHIDTYRLLGKAFLELQRYSEAADVLERVLACVPDDFISQIGMGIIREDQGNLDAAIWHMERAFEAQPSNVGVQVELRRLHGLRDGVEPAKIRLTRGALVRMYARGELFQQAIAEARAALAEDPNRSDLEVILARMYFLSGQKVASTEVCTRLLSRLPFCFEANRILAEILPGTTRAEDAKLYMQRVYSMDPYLAHLTPQATSPSEVPDNAVELEHLEWLSEQEAGQPPEWTKSLGAGWTDQSEPIPEWITGARIEPRIEEPPAQELETPESNLLSEMPADEETPEEPIVQPTEGTQIPEWMQQAGWQPAIGDTEEILPPETAAEESADEEETAPIEKAEIPDWLAAIAPPEQESEITEIEAENPDWLADIVSSGNEETLQPDEASAFEEIPFGTTLGTEEPFVELPVEMTQAADEESAEPVQEPDEFPAGLETPGEVHFDEGIPLIPEIIPQEMASFSSEEEQQVPEWLGNLQAQQSEISDTAEEASPTQGEEITGEPLESQPVKPEEELPEWMRPGSFEASAAVQVPEPIEEAGIEEFEPEVILEDTQPIQIKREEQPIPEPEVPIEEISAKDEPETETSWLEAFDVEKRAEEEVKPSSTGEGGEEMPDWVQEIMADQGDLGETLLPEEKTEFPSIPSEELSFEQQSEQPVKSEPPISYAPEWLTAEPEATEPAESEAVEAETQFDVESAVPEGPHGEAISETEPQTSEGDEAFAWLENLAAKQGVEEDTLLVSPEQRQEEPPAWITEEPEEAEFIPTEAPPAEEGEYEPKVEFQQAEPSVEETIGEEFHELPIEGVEQEPSLNIAQESEEALPDWLKELSAEEEEAAPEKSPEEAPKAEESLGWLEELTLEEAGISPAETIQEPPVSAEPAVEAPTAFKEDESILNAEETADKDVLPDWLKGLDEEKSKEEALPVFGEEEPAAFESADKQESWIPEMAAEAPIDQSTKLLEDTSPVRITPQEEKETLQSSEILTRAQEALEAHNIERSLELYDQLIQSGEYLEDTIHDLRDALYQYPIDSAIWQALGDACMKSSRLQEALDAYTKAEELLR